MRNNLLYLINLKSAKNRLSRMTNILNEKGLRYELVEAIDGRILSQGEINGLYSRFRSWLILNRQMTRSEIGCALSHKKAYHKLLATSEQSCVIFEDDIIVSDLINDAIDLAQETISTERPEVILLSAFDEESSQAPSELGVYNPIGFPWCTDGYVVNRKAAELILRVNTPICICADGWYRWRDCYGLSVKRVYPTTVSQDRGMIESSVDRPESASASRSFLRVKVDGLCYRTRCFVDWILRKINS